MLNMSCVTVFPKIFNIVFPKTTSDEIHLLKGIS